MVERIRHFALHILHRLSLSGLVGVVVLFIVFSLVIGSVQAIQRNFQNQLEVDKLAQEVELMKVESDTLELQNQYYQTDAYLELQARDLLGRVRAGEKVLVLPKVEAQVSPVQAATTTTKDIPLERRNNFEQWLYFLFSDKRINTENT